MMLLQPSNYSQGGGVEINGDGPRQWQPGEKYQSRTSCLRFEIVDREITRKKIVLLGC